MLLNIYSTIRLCNSLIVKFGIQNKTCSLYNKVNRRIPKLLKERVITEFVSYQLFFDISNVTNSSNAHRNKNKQMCHLIPFVT